MELQLTYDSEDEIPAEFKALYTERDGKFHFTAIKIPDVTKVEDTLRKERAKNKALETKLSAFKDLDPEKVQEQLGELEELRVQIEAGNGPPDAAKIQQLVEAGIKRRTTTLDREIEKLKAERDAALSAKGELEANVKRSKITEAARGAAAKAKVVPEAVDDVIMYAERLFDVDDEGVVTVRDNVGITPGLNIEQWLADRSRDRPHWFPQSKGAGGRGSDGKPLGTNPWSKANWNITAQGAIVRERGEEFAGQMANAAGSKIGATRPPE